MQAITMMPSTEGQANFTGPAVRSHGWYGYSDGYHSVSVHVNRLVGRVIIEASLAEQPGDKDWFPIELDGQPHLDFPRMPGRPNDNTGDTGVFGFSFRANVIWLRARLDRSHLSEWLITGDVVKIILNR